ncbi:MAG: hypothetical protein Q9M27_01320, partial [Mariprofundaceae bacterium]|nr:hypothetical protein [Mariprofundaceae bacterium]
IAVLHPAPHIMHRFTIDADAPGGNPAISLTPRAQAGTGEIAVQPFPGDGLQWRMMQIRS